jgi:glutaminase
MMSRVSLPIKGLPGKSGIGGGIVALFPKIFVVATWSPKLKIRQFRIGNACIRIIDDKTGMSVF